MVICHESNVERHFYTQRVRFDRREHRRTEGDENFHTMITALPEERKSIMRIPYRLSPLHYQKAQRHHPYHQRAPHASFVKAESRKGLLWYRPCTSLHRSSSGSEESGLHRDIMELAERIAPVNPGYRHHQTGEDNGDAHLKNLLLHRQWQDRLWLMAVPLLLRIRWATQQTCHRQNHRRVSETKG
jgi:hypothetical protein